MKILILTLVGFLAVSSCLALTDEVEYELEFDDEEEEEETYSEVIDSMGLPPRSIPKCNKYHTSPNTCQNFARFTINEINQQIRMELNASYTYMAMAKFFSRDDVAYTGFSKIFQKMSDEEREHAQMFMDYMNKRGGRIHLKPLPDPKADWNTPLEALRDALGLEHQVNAALLQIHQNAQSKNDPHFLHFLESQFLGEQVEAIKQLSDYVTIMTRLQDQPVGWHIFDQQLLTDKR